MAEAGGIIDMVEDNVKIELFGPDGELKQEVTLHNTITTSGKNGAADQILSGPTLGKPTHMAVGSGTPGSNALGAEIDRNALLTKTRSGAVVTMTATWAPGDGTGALVEAGIFDASSSGNMWCSATFPVVNKSAGDTLSLSWTLTFS